jgi:hypothetical protein
MTDTAKRLSGPTGFSTGNTTHYTVPAATTTIVRSIHVNNTDSSSRTFSVGINGASTANTSLFHTFSLPPNGVMDWSGFLVLNAGDTIQGAASGVAVNMTICGVEVT